MVESKWSSDSGVGKGEKFKISCWNFSPKFSFCVKFQPQKTEKMRTRPQGEERGRRGAALGSDVWTEEEEEELWCRSAAQIRLSHKSLELPRDGQPTASLSVCLFGQTDAEEKEQKVFRGSQTEAAGGAEIRKSGGTRAGGELSLHILL